MKKSLQPLKICANSYENDSEKDLQRPARTPRPLVTPAMEAVVKPGQATVGDLSGAGLPLRAGVPRLARRLTRRLLFTCLPLLVLLGALLKLLLLRQLLLTRLVLLRALLLASLALLILLGALLGLLRLFSQGALTQRVFVLPALLILLAGGFKLLALLVAQQPLLLALGLRLWVTSGVWPGLLG